MNKSKTGGPDHTSEFLANSFVEFNANDSIYYIREGNLIATTKIEWTFDAGACVMKFQDWNGDLLFWEVDGIFLDTLILINKNTASLSHFLVKEQNNAVLNCQGKLKDKALEQIRACIMGNWQLHYMEGGITGNIRQDFTNSFVDFKPNDSIYFVDQGALTVKDKIEWVRTIDMVNELTYIMSFYDWRSYAYSWGVDQIKGDTLVLYDDGHDGFRYYLTLKK